MIVEYKNGGVELYGTVFKDAETKQAGSMTLAEAVISEHTEKGSDGKYHTFTEKIIGKFSTLAMVQKLRKDDNVKVKGVRKTREYEKDGQKKTASEIEAQWVEVWGVGAPAATRPAAPAQNARREPGDDNMGDDDTPF